MKPTLTWCGASGMRFRLGSSPPTCGAAALRCRASAHPCRHYIARYAEAAHLVGDEALMNEFIEWLQPLLAIRGVPPASLAAGLDVLVEAATTPELGAAAVRARAHLATLSDPSTGRPVTPERSSTEH